MKIVERAAGFTVLRDAGYAENAERRKPPEDRAGSQKDTQSGQHVSTGLDSNVLCRAERNEKKRDFSAPSVISAVNDHLK
jgi:hypothetical protein